MNSATGVNYKCPGDKELTGHSTTLNSEHPVYVPKLGYSVWLWFTA